MSGQVTEEHFSRGLIYPPLSNIRKISAHIAANVAAKAYELGKWWLFLYYVLVVEVLNIFECYDLAGLATRLPRPENLVKHAESCMYSPTYRNYR